MKKWVSSLGFLIILAITMALCIVALVFNEANQPREKVITAMIICSFILVLCIMVCIAIPVCVKKLSKMNIELPLILPNTIRNSIKNPVRKKVYIGVVIYAVVMITFLATLAIISIKKDSDEVFIKVMIPVFAVMLFLLPFVLRYVKSKEIIFFAKYFDFKSTPNFKPSDKVFGNFPQCVFSRDGLIIKPCTTESIKDSSSSEYYLQTQNITIAYNDLKFHAKPAYRTMGDMMTVFIEATVSEHAEKEEILTTVFPNFQSENMYEYVDFKTNDYEAPILYFELDQNLFDYLKYYKVNVTNLDYIISNRLALMKKNCKSAGFFYLEAIFKKNKK